MWTVLIEALLATVGPILEKAILAWLSQRLHIEALSLQPASDAPDKLNKLTLLQRVRDSLWFFQFAKINAVDAAIARVKLG